LRRLVTRKQKMGRRKRKKIMGGGSKVRRGSKRGLQRCGKIVRWRGEKGSEQEDRKEKERGGTQSIIGEKKEGGEKGNQGEEALGPATQITWNVRAAHAGKKELENKDKHKQNKRGMRKGRRHQKKIKKAHGHGGKVEKKYRARGKTIKTKEKRLTIP